MFCLLTGADDFTPMLIYVVIKAQTATLASNLAYIERYRMQSKLTSESHYYFIQLVSHVKLAIRVPAALCLHCVHLGITVHTACLGWLLWRKQFVVVVLWW